MATQAVTAQGEKLYVKINSTWHKIGEVKSTPEIGESADKIDATHLECDVKTYIKDIPDLASDLEFTCNAMPVGAEGSNVALVMGMSRNKAYDWKYVMPRLGIQVEFRGDWSYRFGAGAVSTVKDLIITVIPRSMPIESAIEGQYTLSYDSNGGTGTMPAQTADAGEAVVAGENAFNAPSGKHFAFWNTTSDGTGASYDPSDEVPMYENMTLYAIWSDGEWSTTAELTH